MALHSFTTPRLTVRHWADTLRDPARRAALKGDVARLLTPAVLAPLPPTLHPSGGTITQWIDARAAESDVSTLHETATGTFIGLLILAPFPAATGTQVHLGYLLAEQVWGRGLASELLRGLVGAAEHAAPITLIGGVATDNPASARVLQKAGFQRDPQRSAQDADIYRLALT